MQIIGQDAKVLDSHDLAKERPGSICIPAKKMGMQMGLL
jgi:hypothetical protein